MSTRAATSNKLFEQIARGSLFICLLASLGSPHNSAAELTPELRTLFSPGDLLIEKVANQYGADFNETLKQLEKIEDRIYSSGIDEVSYLLAYRCYMQVSTENKEGLNQTMAEYGRLKELNSNNRSIYASESFCLAWQANKINDYKAYDLNLEKAYQHVSASNSAVLRYWISFTFASLTSAVGRYNDSIEASQLALDVAVRNKDQYREATVRSILALSEAELGYNEDALKNNQLAIDWNLSKNYQHAVLELY